jgi:hypothetical protein
MLRGCLLALLLLAALGFGYYYWLDQTFEPPASWIAGILAGFFVMCCLGALNNARTAWRDASQVSSAKQDLQLADGRLATISGTIHPVGEPLIAPFSATPCVICEYDIASQKRLSAGSDNENSGSDFAGFLMTPCLVRTPFGDVRLLGFPILEGFGEQRCDSVVAAGMAREFMRSHEFEDRTGIKIVTVLSVFGEIWADDDGQVEKNFKLGKVTLDELFPATLDTDLLNMAKQEAEQPEVEDEDEEDNENDEDFDDDQGPVLLTEPPKLVEKRVDVGEHVCAIGIYNEMRRGLLPPRGSTSPNRLLRGTAEQIQKRSRAAMFQNFVGGLVGLAVIHGFIVLAMFLYRHSEETIRDQRHRAEQAVRSNQPEKLEPLLRRGFDINAKNPEGRTLLMEAEHPEMITWLHEHGAH